MFTPCRLPEIAAAVLFGVMAGTLCNFATQLKFLFGYDDCLDVRVFFSGTTMATRGDAVHLAPVDFCVACYWRYCGKCGCYNM